MESLIIVYTDIATNITLIPSSCPDNFKKKPVIIATIIGSRILFKSMLIVGIGKPILYMMETDHYTIEVIVYIQSHMIKDNVHMTKTTP